MKKNIRSSVAPRTLQVLAKGLSLAVVPLIGWIGLAKGPLPVPSNVLPLTNLTLTLPINDSGKEQMFTKAVNIKSTVLNNGYTSKYFYTAPDSGVAFWCPIDGATTSPGVGTDHPRCELVDPFLWTMDKGGTLSATLAVNQTPGNKQDIIIEQIHGGGTASAAPFVMLHYTAGNLVCFVKGELTGNTGTVKSTLLTKVALNTRIACSISTNGTDITVKAAAAGAIGTGSWTTPVPTAWSGVPVHFSAGDYVQDTGASSTDGGKVTFYKLSIAYGQPLSLIGNGYRLSISASGLPMLSWHGGIGLNNLMKRSESQGPEVAASLVANSGTDVFRLTDPTPWEGKSRYWIENRSLDGTARTSPVFIFEKPNPRPAIWGLMPDGTFWADGRLEGQTGKLVDVNGKTLALLSVRQGRNKLPAQRILPGSIRYWVVNNHSYKLPL